MKRQTISNRHIKCIAAWASFDIIIILSAYTAAFLARATTTSLDFARGFPLIVFSAAVTLCLLYTFGAYHRIWSRTSGHDIKILVNAIVVSTAVVTTVDVIFHSRPLPFSVILLGNVLTLMGVIAIRYRSRLISGLSWRWKAVWSQEFPHKPTRVLIVGAGETGQTTAWRVKYRSPAGTRYQVVCFVDDDPAKQGMYLEGSPVLGGSADIPRLVNEHNIGLILMAIQNISGSEFRKILSYCESTEARIKVIPDMFALLMRNHEAPLLRDIQAEDLLGRKPVGRHENVDLERVKNKVVLVTGAAGSIGSELCRQLLSYKPTKLLLFDNNESALHDLTIELNNTTDINLIPILGDITSYAILKRVFSEHSPQVVFHSAAYKHVPMLERFPEEAIRVNILGTRQVAEIACEHEVERFVLISTDKAVNPTSVMGASKRVCEYLVYALAQQTSHNTLLTSVRFGNVLGSRGSVVPIFNRQIEAGGPVTVTDPNMTRYFISIPEAANLVIHAACLTEGGELFMLNMGEDIRIVELAERMIRLHGLRPYHDIPIEFTGMRPGEKLHEELFDVSETPVASSHPDIVKLRDSKNDFEADTFFSQVDNFLSNLGTPGFDARNQVFVLAGSKEAIQPEYADSHGQEVSITPVLVRLATASTFDGSKKMNIPMSSPDITQAEIDAVTEVLQTRWLSLGPKLDQFEGAFAAYAGRKHAIGVNSGTSGLHLAMIAAGVGRGDEVITPSFSFIASANCVLYEGATPVFVDVDPLTSNLYPLALEEAITERTKAIIVVHAFGQPADMDPVLEIARKHNLVVIEDACEAIGAEYKGRRAGTMSDAAVFAFYPNKQMTTGEGGMIVTDNDEWATLFRSLRNQGRDVHDAWLRHSRLGYNYRLDEMSAALGLCQIQRIEEMLAKREQVAEWYNARVDRIPDLHKPYIAQETTRMSWFVYVVRCADHVDREEMMDYLKDQGIPSRVYFNPIHLQPFYHRRFAHQSRKLPNTERAGNTFLALPFSGVMTEEQVDYVCHHLAVGVEQASNHAAISIRPMPEQQIRPHFEIQH